MRTPDFAKVFVSILDSTIANNWRARHLFEDLLKLADWQGRVDMTPEAIARRTGWPHGLEAIRDDLAVLNAPDDQSRTPDEEGRRIVLLEDARAWGWRIVNIEAYRNAGDSDKLREQARERKRRQRAKERETTPGPTETPSETIRRALRVLAPKMRHPEEAYVTRWLAKAGGDPWKIAAVLCEKALHLQRVTNCAYISRIVTERHEEASGGWPERYSDAREYVEFTLSTFSDRLARSGHA